MRDEMVAERLRESKGAKLSCRGDALAFALGRELKCPKDHDCKTCAAGLMDELADAIEAEQAELRDLLDFQRDTFTRERDCLCKDIEELKRKTSEYKRMLDFRKELEDKTIVFNGLRDLANTSKFHQNSEWKRIVMRLTENAEDYANRVLAEARERTKTEHDGVDVDELLFLARFFHNMSDTCNRYGVLVQYEDLTEWRDVIRNAVKGITHRKPDTFESVVTEMLADFDAHDTIELDGYFARLRKLKGGESHE